MENYDQLIKRVLNASREDPDAADWIKDALKRMNSAALLTYLHQQKITGIFAHQLRVLGLYGDAPAELMHAFDKYLRAVLLYNRMATDELKRFVSLSGAPVYLVKGIALECTRIYPEGIRAVGDLDVLISYPACLESWNRSLQSDSYLADEYFLSDLHKRVLSAYPSYEHHHLPALRSTTFSMLTVEIHPQVYCPSMGVSAAEEAIYATVSQEALARGNALDTLPGGQVLCAEDHLLFICFHLLDNWRKGELTWRMLCDVHALVMAKPELDWEKCGAIAKQLGRYAAFLRALSMVNAYLFIPVPAHFVLHFEYAPGEMKALNRKGLESFVHVSLYRRLCFTLRKLRAREMPVYIAKTLIPDRAYIQKEFAQKYEKGGMPAGIYFHLLSKLKILF